MNIKTERLVIKEFSRDMAMAVHKNSLDEDTRRFLPDEVFETVEDAEETIDFLMSQYGGTDGPLVYPVLLKDGTNIGYVQAVPIEDDDWEIGYHIGKAYTCKGYATEAVMAFLPVIMSDLGIKKISGICVKENIASCKVLEKIGFVYTFPEHRGKRLVGKLLKEAFEQAKKDGYKYIYISTGETGLYEKYGYSFWKMMKDVEGGESRVYRIDIV